MSIINKYEQFIFSNSNWLVLIGAGDGSEIMNCVKQQANIRITVFDLDESALISLQQKFAHFKNIKVFNPKRDCLNEFWTEFKCELPPVIYNVNTYTDQQNEYYELFRLFTGRSLKGIEKYYDLEFISAQEASHELLTIHQLSQILSPTSRAAIACQALKELIK